MVVRQRRQDDPRGDLAGIAPNDNNQPGNIPAIMS